MVMTIEEGKKMVEELKREGLSEENIVAGFYQLFIDGDVDINQLGDLVQLVGWELTDEFRNLSPEDQKTKGWEVDEDASDVSEEENEEAKEYEPNSNEDSNSSSDEDSKEDTSSEDKDEKDTSENAEDSNDSGKEESEEEQEERAKKLFGLK